MADKELRLQQAVTEVIDQNDKVHEGVVMTDEVMLDLVKDIDGLKAEMEKT